MNKKIYKGLGLLVSILTVLSLGIGVVPGTSPSPEAEAAVGSLRFENIPLPKYPAQDGKFTVIAADATLADLGPIAVSPSGQVLYTAADNGTSNVTQLKKSSDGGYTWETVTAFTTAAAAAPVDITPITVIKISPNYATDSTLWVATTINIYQSVDAGTSFVRVFRQGTEMSATSIITGLDIALDKTGRLSEIAGTAEAAAGVINFTTGAVFVRSPATTGLGWVNQLLGGVAAGPPVAAVSFSSKFANDEGIFAVSTDDAAAGFTKIHAAFGSTKNGGGWGNAVGEGTFFADNGDNITRSRAVIGFPDDFDANSLSANIAFVGIFSNSRANGTAETLAEENGDVYKVVFQPTRSSTIDVNVRGQEAALRFTRTNIASIDVTGAAAAAKIVVGTDKWDTGATNYYWTTYYSNDSGATWLSAREKSATGGSLGNSLTPAAGANVQVAFSPADANIIFATSNGDSTSAVSRSKDGGKSFNGISLIEYGGTDGNDTTNFYTIANTSIASNDVMHIMTSTGNTTTTRRGAYWQTTNGGNTWERVWSYANPSVSDQLDRISRTADNTTFVIDRVGNTIWRSTDNGVSFPRKLTGPGVAVTTIAATSFVDANTIWIAYSGTPAQLWFTTNMGLPWTQMDDDRVISGTLGPGIARSGTNMILTAGNRNFFSSDSGKIFKVLGVADMTAIAGPNAGGAAFDRNFATNKYVYGNIGDPAAPFTGGGGIWRITVDTANPSASAWRRIDNIAGSGGTANPNATIPGPGPMFHLAPDNLYIIDTANVTGATGGLLRSVNPDADADGIYPPRFDVVNRDLPTGTGNSFNFAGFIPAGPIRFFVKNNTLPQVAAAAATGQPAYFNQLFGLADTAGVGPTQTTPADKATAQGLRLNTEDLRFSVEYVWAAMAGITNYQIQISRDAAFASLFFDTGEVLPITTTVTTVLNHLPNATYYWRVRALLPVLSPWSAARSFTVGTTELLETVVDLKSPPMGSQDVGLKPTFAWSAVIGAVGYDWEVAKDAAFTVPVERAGGTPSKINAVVLTHDLEYNTTYYWRVRAQTVVKPPAFTAYANGIFTTMAEPKAPTPPVVIPPAQPPTVIQVPAPAAIPTYLLWAIIIIGAVLVIAVIVLIVRTRRVP